MSTMSVRAKFRVTSVTKYDNNHNEVKLQVVYGNSPENKAFYAATPNGNISLSMVQPDVAALLELGKEFYVDFTKADE